MQENVFLTLIYFILANSMSWCLQCLDYDSLGCNNNCVDFIIHTSFLIMILFLADVVKPQYIINVIPKTLGKSDSFED